MTRTMTCRVAAVAAGVLVCGVAASCERTGTPAASSTVLLDSIDTVEVEAESSSMPAMPLRRGRMDSVIAARETPPLPNSIDAMTNAQVKDYLGTLAYKTGKVSTDSQKPSCADQGPSCDLNGPAYLLIQPEAGMNRRPFDSLPQHGLVVGRILNTAAPGTAADSFAYPARKKTWWVVDSAGGAWRSRYFVRTYLDTGPAIRFVTATRPFIKCPHLDSLRKRISRAKFWSCSTSADSLRASLSARQTGDQRGPERSASYFHQVSLRSAVPLPLVPLPITVTSNWVSCGAGCCATSTQ